MIRYSNSYTDYRKILTENRVQHYETEIVPMNRAKQPRLNDREDKLALLVVPVKHVHV